MNTPGGLHPTAWHIEQRFNAARVLTEETVTVPAMDVWWLLNEVRLASLNHLEVIGLTTMGDLPPSDAIRTCIFSYGGCEDDDTDVVAKADTQLKTLLTALRACRTTLKAHRDSVYQGPVTIPAWSYTADPR